MFDKPPFSKPRVVFNGEASDCLELLGEAYNLLYKVRQICKTSGAPVFAMSRKVDGGTIHAAVLETEDVVEVTPETRAAVALPPEAEVQPKYYLDSGWMHRQIDGVIEDIRTAQVVLLSTKAAAATYAAVRKRVRRSFRPDYGSKASGKSVGVGYDYDAVSDAALREALIAQHTAVLKEKVRTLPLIGKVTGLLRCWVKGQYGRALSEGFDLAYRSPSPGSFRFNMGDLVLDVGEWGVIHDAHGFYAVKIVMGGDVEMWKMSTPPDLSALFSEFLAESDPKIKAALATYILSRSTVTVEKDSGGYPLPEQPSRRIVSCPPVAFPGVHGWKFSMFSRACIGTHFFPVGKGIGFETTEIVFNPPDFRDPASNGGATVKNMDGGVYVFGHTPRVWFPTAGLESYPISGFDPVPNTSTVRFYSFYNSEDVPVVPWLQVSAFKTGTERLETINKTACFSGESIIKTVDLIGTQYRTAVGVDGLGAAASGTYQGLLSESYQSGYMAEPGRVFLIGEGFRTGGCASSGQTQVSDQSTNYLVHALAGELTLTTATMNTSFHPLYAFSVPFSFVDAAVMIHGERTSSQGSPAVSLVHNAIAGYDTISKKTGATYLTSRLAVPRSLGLIESGPFTVIEPLPTTVKLYSSVTLTATMFTPDGAAGSVSESDETTDGTYANVPLNTFVIGNGPVFHAPLVVFSMHNEGWFQVSPYQNVVAFGGISAPRKVNGYITDLYPIGFQ